MLLVGVTAFSVRDGLAGARFESENADLEMELHEAVNRHRAQLRKPALRFDPLLAEIAREHSRAMAAGAVPVGHGGFEARTRAIWEATRYRAVGENVAVNNLPREATVKAAVEGLLSSPRHRLNLEGDFDRTGVGIARDARGTFYYTEVLVR